MDLHIRNVDAVAIAKIEETSKQLGITKSKYIRRYINRIAIMGEIEDIEDDYKTLVDKGVLAINLMSEEIENLRNEIQVLTDVQNTQPDNLTYNEWWKK